jgi:hypothetical protein
MEVHHLFIKQAQISKLAFKIKKLKAFKVEFQVILNRETYLKIKLLV